MSETPTERKAQFSDEAKRFVDHIESIRATVPLLLAGIAGVANEERKAFKDWVKSADIDQSTDESTGTGKPHTFHVPAGHYSDFLAKLRRLNSITLAQRVFPRTFIVALVSQFDALIGGLIREMYTVRPEMLSSSEKQLTFAQLASFGSIEDAREFIIEKEVEGVLRESHSEQFGWLEGKLKVPLRKGLRSWPTFIELTERRNLFVHTEGRVSRQYIQVCTAHGALLNDAKPGESLRVSAGYFKQGCDCVTEIGVKLSQVMWRKLLPHDLAAADASLNAIALDLIKHANYSLAATLLEFATDTLKKHGDEQSKLIFVLNRAQAAKWQGEEAEMRSVLESVDWSSKSDTLRLGRAVLLDQCDDAAALMERIGDKPPNTELSYRDWPIFAQFRQTAQFRSAYRKVFGQEFDAGTQEVPEAADELVGDGE